MGGGDSGDNASWRGWGGDSGLVGIVGRGVGIVGGGDSKDNGIMAWVGWRQRISWRCW